MASGTTSYSLDEVGNLISIKVLMAADVPDDFLDPHEMGFHCLQCGQHLKETIARLKADDHFICPGCGASYETAKFREGTDTINKAIRHFGEHFRKIQKSLKR